MRKHQCYFRFYEELNDFLPPEQRKKSFEYCFAGSPSVKDAIEALGVPHTEVDLILVNGQSENFSYQLQPNDQISVYPVFESLDITPIIRLRPHPLRESKFVVDVHLGKLARLLRMLGLNAAYRNDLTDTEIIRMSLAENRIILTRDVGILKHSQVSHGYFIRSALPEAQLQAVLDRFDLYAQIQPFQRCLECNGSIEAVAKSEVLGKVPPRIEQEFDKFHRCQNCRKIYWPGSHYQRMQEKIDRILRQKSDHNRKSTRSL